MTNGNFTPTQSAMLQVLSDGRPHPKSDLHACLPDPEGTKDNIKVHICRMRKRLRPAGKDILCVWDRRRWFYRLVRLINTSE